MLNDLREQELIEFSRRVDNINIRVTCVDHDVERTVMNVCDFRNLGNQYMMFHGEPFMVCTSCGAVVRKTNNRQRYCKDCAVRINSAKTWQNARAAQ